MKEIKGRIELRYDSYNNWRSVNPILRSGEVGFATQESPLSTSCLFLGNGVSTINELLAEENGSEYEPSARSTSYAVFYSGIGAGYRLPVASESVIGGISIDPSYYEIISNRLTPTSYTKQYISDLGQTIVLQEGYNFQVDGTIKCTELTTSKEHIVTSYYIDLNTSIGEEATTPLNYSYPHAGMFIDHFQDGASGQKISAFMGIDLDGYPRISSNYLKNDPYGSPDLKYLVVADNISNGFLKINGGIASPVTLPTLTINYTVDGGEFSQYFYNGEEEVTLTLNTMSNYCTKIQVGETIYEVADNVINVGDSIWDETKNEEFDILKDSVQNIETNYTTKIIIDGKEFTSANNTITIDNILEDLSIQSSNSTITIEKTEESYDLKHYNVNPNIETTPAIGDYKSNILYTIGTLEVDSLGHITNLQLVRFDLSDINKRLNALENK